MADESPGKVQALRAIFTEKNNPVMGMLPLNQKTPYRPWKQQNELTEVISLKEKNINEQMMTKVLPFPAKSSTVNSEESCKDSERTTSKKYLKPAIGPKPVSLVNQGKTSSSSSCNSVDISCKRTIDNKAQNNPSDNKSLKINEDKSKAFGETIASFMFNTELSNKENSERIAIDIKNSSSKLGNSQAEKNVNSKIGLVNLPNSQVHHALSKQEFDASCCNIISSDNYVCKSNCNFRRKELPSVEKLGPAPLKPSKPNHLRLPSRYSSQISSVSEKVQISQPPQLPAPILPEKPPDLLRTSCRQISHFSENNQFSQPPSYPAPILSEKPPIPQRPSHPCPPRPLTPPPLPPITVPVIIPSSNPMREEIEELYEDTLLDEKKRPVSLIPEYTEEEEQSEELYNDAGEIDEEASVFSVSSVSSSPVKPKDPPPPCPSEYLQPNIHGSTEELYQDAEEPNQEEFYEEMPCDTVVEESEVPLYSNNRKEIDKLRREEEKRLRKEQKEREKREKELEKLKKKFGLTGEEVPIDDGLVKADSRGGKGDLPVKKGETVLILRMEGNPSGKWLVKNEKGKIGYVELTNIEVDPLSVKSVMAIGRLSIISTSEELYSEAISEEEAIYEVTY